MTPRHRIADELAANADALRALAIDLVGRGDAADLVQDTAVRALRSPPAEPHALGAWLATVLRNLASNHRRGDARRRRREHAAPSIGDVAPADVELERREVLRTVTDALWCLPEPYQSALVWRYFENLTPSAIAAQKGLPLATVKSRLQRGLQAMRTELDRRDRGRWRAIVPFAFGSEARPPIAAATAAALIMTPTAKVLSIAAAAAAVVLVLLLLRAGEPTPPASGDRIARAAPAAGGVYREPAIADPTGVARTSVASVDASPAVDLSHPYEFALRCRVVDRDGLPVVGAKLGFNLRDHTPNLWPTPTDRDGSVELRWRGRVERLTMAIGLLMHGRGLALREVSVRAGASQQIELLADFGGAGDGPCEAGSRRPEVACRRCHQGPVLPEVFTPRLDLLTRLHPETSLADRLAAVIVADADAVPPSPPEEEEVSLSDITEGASDEFGTITGLVLGAENRPVAGATVAWGHTADRPEDRVRTRADGTFELQLVEPGDVVVRAGGGAAGLATAPLRVFGGQVANCTLQLLRGRVLTGRVLLPDGASPADWRVHFVGSPGALPDGTLVRSDGRFELANLPPGVGQLLLAGPVDARLPFATAANARTDGDEVVFDLRATGVPAGLLRLPPDSGAVDLWVWQRESGCGAAARQLPDGSFELGMLASGNYTVVAAGEVFGTVSLGEIWIDGRGVTELGPLSQPSPGELVLPEPVSRGRIELYRRLPELDLCAHLPTLKGGERLRLPAGRWLLLSGEPGAPMAREFEVAAGRVVELDAGAGGPR